MLKVRIVRSANYYRMIRTGKGTRLGWIRHRPEPDSTISDQSSDQISPCVGCERRTTNMVDQKICLLQNDMRCNENPRTFLKRIGGVELTSPRVRWPWSYEDADVISCRHRIGDPILPEPSLDLSADLPFSVPPLVPPLDPPLVPPLVADDDLIPPTKVWP